LEGGVSYIDARKKVLERRTGLRSSEKELPGPRSSAKELTERRYGAFGHKNASGYKYSESICSFMQIYNNKKIS